MKMNKIFAMALALGVSALLAGCSDAATEEEIAPAPVAATHSIFANILNDEEGDGTRAYVDNVSYQVKWETDDAISYFNDGDATPTQAILDPRYDGETYGMFKYNGNAVPENMDDYKTKYGAFPYNANDKAASGTINTELPAVQTYHERSFGGQNVYMTAFIPAASGGTLNFQSYHSGIGLELKGSGKGFKVIVTSEGAQNVAGKVSIPMPTNGGAPKAEVTNGSKSVTLDCSEVELTGGEQSFWIALLPGYYDKLRVRITNIAGTQEYFNKTVSKATFTQKKVKRFKVSDAINVVNADHTKNPLLKWAEGNLQRTGSGASAKGTNATSYTSTGYYYQFGRNHGYSSANNAANKYTVETSDISNNVYPGTGTTDPIRGYDAMKSISSYPTYFFIDITDNGDYKYPDHTETWAQRAKSNGYTYESPCPAGWHVPTMAEYKKEIMPVINGAAGMTGSTAWNTFAQFKTMDDGTKCAYRWSKYTSGSYTYLKVECLVVSENTSDIQAVDWSDENVVTRYFKGAGMIQSDRYRWSFSYPVVGVHYTARPLNWGQYIGTTQSNGTVLVESVKNYMNHGGFYWTSDSTQGVFALFFDTYPGITPIGYYMTTFNTSIGANIRCVKNETK